MIMNRQSNAFQGHVSDNSTRISARGFSLVVLSKTLTKGVCRVNKDKYIKYYWSKKDKESVHKSINYSATIWHRSF